MKRLNFSRKCLHYPFLILCILVTLYVLILVLPEDETNGNSETYDSPFVFMDFTRNSQNVCVLPVYDIWNKTIRSLMKGFNPMKNCDNSFEKWTKLDNSTWRIVKAEANCSARCFGAIGATEKVVFREWILPGQVDCEFLEAVCYENSTEVYGYIHSQVLPKPSENKTITKPPNVFVFTIDSLSTGMARRSLPKFISYFQSEFEGVEFPFVNKVGENSQPNGYPLWFGKSIESGRTVEWEELKADWNYTEHCGRYLDNYTNIFKKFKEHGYITALLEDWKDTMVDSWPFCKGFKKSPTDHTFRPFASAIGEHGSNITREHLDGHHCREIHHALFDYLEQLFGAYEDRPLFSWTWLSTITHSYIDGAARLDEFLIEYFKKNHETVENSFVFFVSDHGLRFGYGLGDYLKTEIGAFERHNPYLAISIPRSLRSNNPDILRTLRENSLQLQTHYDTRATLLDILKFQPMAEFKDRHPKKIVGEKGNSLIRRQPSSPRTCATLPIPLQYCICQVAKLEIRDKPLRKYLGQRLVDHVNSLLSKSSMSEICETHQIKKATSLTEFGYSKQFKTYKISVQTNYAHFEAMMMYDQKKDGTKFTKVVRLDSYGDTVDCTEKIGHEPLCHCKKEKKWFWSMPLF